MHVKIVDREISAGARSAFARPWTIDSLEVARIVTYDRVYRIYEANYADGKQRGELRREFVATCGAMSVAPPERPRSPEVAPTPCLGRGVSGIGEV